jgi:hypothetical protein
MRYRSILIVLTAAVPLAFFASQLGFDDSLHATREGKAFFYSQANGGFETLTGIPMADLSCKNCHAPTKADGTPINAETYDPDCADCHNFGQGTAVPDNVCLGCHSRQGAEVTLSGSTNPDVAALFSDVHRDAGVQCTACHPKAEFPVVHGESSTVYNSMLEEGAAYSDCENCHDPAGLPANTEHSTHLDYLECNACHSKTVITCYNCHFETEVEADMKRYYGKPPMFGFALLVNDPQTGKVTTATLQALTYNEQSFYTIAPFHSHTIGRDVRECTDCHDTELTRGYDTNGEIPVVQWDSDQGRLVNTKGMIPVPSDWETALLFDFVRYKGDTSDPFGALDPAQWELMKSGADLTQMLSQFATPLTADQMAKLSTNVLVGTEDEPTVPVTYELEQNYPNPFNPSTTIRYSVPWSGPVTVTIFDLVGREVETLFEGDKSPGTYEVMWDAANEPSGLYFYRLQAGDFEETKSMLLVR